MKLTEGKAIFFKCQGGKPDPGVTISGRLLGAPSDQ